MSQRTQGAPSPGASPTKARPADAPAFAAAAQLEDAAGLAARLAGTIWDALPGESSAAAISAAARAYTDALSRLASSLPEEDAAPGETGAPDVWARVVPRALLEALDAPGVSGPDGGVPDRALAVVLGDLAGVSRELHAQSVRQCALADRLDALLARRT